MQKSHMISKLKIENESITNKLNNYQKEAQEQNNLNNNNKKEISNITNKFSLADLAMEESVSLPTPAKPDKPSAVLDLGTSQISLEERKDWRILPVLF